MCCLPAKDNIVTSFVLNNRSCYTLVEVTLQVYALDMQGYRCLAVVRVALPALPVMDTQSWVPSHGYPVMDTQSWISSHGYPVTDNQSWILSNVHVCICTPAGIRKK